MQNLYVNKFFRQVKEIMGRLIFLHRGCIPCTRENRRRSRWSRGAVGVGGALRARLRLTDLASQAVVWWKGWKQKKPAFNGGLQLKLGGRLVRLARTLCLDRLQENDAVLDVSRHDVELQDRALGRIVPAPDSADLNGVSQLVLAVVICADDGAEFGSE